MLSWCLFCLFVFVVILEKLGGRAIDIILKQRMVVFSGFCLFAHFIYLFSQALQIWNFSSPGVILMNPFHFLQSITCPLLTFCFVCMPFKNWPGLDLCEATLFAPVPPSALPEGFFFFCHYDYNWIFGSCSVLLSHFPSYISCHWVLPLSYEFSKSTSTSLITLNSGMT